MKNFVLFSLILLISPLIAQEEDTIVITGEKQDEEEPQQKSVIGSDEIKALEGATTSEIVANAMGVKISKMGGESQGAFVSIRGSSPEQVLVLINGKKVNSAQGGGVNLDLIPKESIEKIEVIRGGNSALYGNSAFGGVINIITKPNDDFFLKAGYSVDSRLNNRIKGSFNNNLGEAFSVSGAISSLISNGEYSYSYRGSEDTRSNSDIKSLNTVVDLNYTGLNYFEFNLYGNFYIDDKGSPGLVEFPSPDARMKDRVINGALYGSYKETIDISLNYLSKVREYSNPTYPLGEVNDKHDFTSFQSSLGFNNGHIKSELKFEYNRLDSTAYDTGVVDRFESSLYVQPNLTFYDLKLFPAVRADLIEQDEPVLSWSLGALYPFSSWFELRGNCSSAYRVPGFDDLFWPDSAFASGNPSLKNEKAIIYDLGLGWEITDYISLDLTGYYHDIKDLIVWNPGPSGIWTPNNFGKAEIKGIETEVSFMSEIEPLSGYLEGRLNYTYMSALNKVDGALYGKKLINRAEHKGNLILIFNSFYDFTISADLGYTGLRYVTNANTKSYPGYFLLDLNSSYSFLDGFKASLFIKNVLDERYEDYRGFPVPGRTFGFNIEYRLDLNE